MMLFFSLFHKSSDYRLIGNETAAARSAKSNLRGNNDRSIKESDVLQLQDAFWGIVFLENENENPPFNRRNRLENVSISVVIGYENSKKKRVTVNTFEESVETGY